MFGVGVWITVRAILPDDRRAAFHEHGTSSAYPSIGGAPTGATVAAATQPHSEHVGYLDPRVRAWMIAGLVMGHAQAMTSQAIGFLVIDRLHIAPALALEPTGIVLMMGAGAALLVQWGVIPLLGLTPRRLVLVGLVLAAIGVALTGLATSLYGIATAYALANLGFGFTRPGFYRGVEPCRRTRRARVGGRQGDERQRRELRARPLDRRRPVRTVAAAAVSDRGGGAGGAIRLCVGGAAGAGLIRAPKNRSP